MRYMLHLDEAQRIMLAWEADLVRVVNNDTVSFYVGTDDVTLHIRALFSNNLIVGSSCLWGRLKEVSWPITEANPTPWRY